MNVLIRTDASVAIGTGHVMRCLSLADALQKRGAEVRFLCRSLPGDLPELVGRRHRLSLLDADASDWRADARASLAFAQDLGTDWIVVDHYGLDAAWEQAQRPAGACLLAIDDLADRPHHCDLLLDQNLHPSAERRYAALVPASCGQLLGPRYALLRDEFARARQSLRERDGSVRRLLIMFGGADAGNETGKTLQAIAGLKAQNLDVEVVVGRSNPHHETVSRQCAALGARFHRGASDMAALMAAADLALGAGGTTTWERACVGLPALISAVAANQIEIARCMQSAGACRYLGIAEEVTVMDWAGELGRLLESQAAVRDMSQAAAALTDGSGADKVAAAMEMVP